MNRTKWIDLSLAIYLCLIPESVASNWSQPDSHLQYDSSEISVRLPDSIFLEKYYSNRTFDYGDKLTPREDIGLWMRLWQLIGKWFYNLRIFFDAIPLLFIALLVALVVLFVYILITKTRLYTLFYDRKELTAIAFNEDGADELEENIDRQIEKEIQQQNFRTAIRYMYIKALRGLEVRQHIVYGRGKTNYDFISELKDTPFYTDFMHSAFTYEYVWYGNFVPSRQGFDALSGSFNRLFDQLNV